jgi:hypothetical protein
VHELLKTSNLGDVFAFVMFCLKVVDASTNYYIGYNYAVGFHEGTDKGSGEDVAIKVIQIDTSSTGYAAVQVYQGTLDTATPSMTAPSTSPGMTMMSSSNSIPTQTLSDAHSASSPPLHDRIYKSNETSDSI